MRKKQPTALGVYIFAGGFTLGVRKHFEVLAHLEDGMFGVETVRNNLGLTVHTNPATWPLDDFVGTDFVYGNPPCAPWSGAGVVPIKNRSFESQNVKYKTDPRTSCVYNLFNVLHRLKPKVWAWESVPMAWTRGRPMIDELTEGALSLGYSASYVLFQGADVGVPQNRPRFFCLFHKVAIPWQYPENPKQITVREAFKGIKYNPDRQYPISPINKLILPHTLQGESLAKTYERRTPQPWPRNALGGVAGRPGFGHVRLRWDAIANTHTGGPHVYHPEENRLISNDEAKAIGGYPDDYHFTGTLGQQFAQMFQAVLPPAGDWLGENVRRAIDENKRTRGQVWLHDFRVGKHERIK